MGACRTALLILMDALLETTMNATIEAASAAQNLESISSEDVTCIYCGSPTPTHSSGAIPFEGHVPSCISIVRCHLCGKEAPYPK